MNMAEEFDGCPSIDRVFTLVRDYLRRRAKHVVRILTGPACEQWLLAEIRVAINWAKPPLPKSKHWICGESRKRDLAIKLPECGGEDGGRVAHVIEAKLLYPTGSPVWVTNRLKELREQVLRKGCTDECDGMTRSGLIFAVWSNWNSKWDRLLKKKTCDGFWDAVAADVQRVFGQQGFDIGNSGCLDPIIAPLPIQVAGRQTEIGLAGTWITANACQSAAVT